MPILVGDYLDAPVAAPRSSIPWIVSLGVHCGIILLLSTGMPLRYTPSEILSGEALLAEYEQDIIWHTFQRKMPITKPLQALPRHDRSNKAAVQAPQTIIANSAAPQSQKQAVWSTGLTLEIQREISSTNLIVWSPPKISPLRFEMENLTFKTSTVEPFEPEAAPVVKGEWKNSVSLNSIRPLPPLRYQSFHDQPEKTHQEDLRVLDQDSAPKIVLSHTTNIPQDFFRPMIEPLRFWSETKPVVVPARRILTGDPFPQVRVNPNFNVNLQEIHPLDPLRYQMYPKPLQTSRTEVLGPAESPNLVNVISGEVNTIGSIVNETISPEMIGGDLAVIGLNPTEDIDVRFLIGRRQARFSSAPDGGTEGEGKLDAGSDTSPISIPGLSVGDSTSMDDSSLFEMAALSVGHRDKRKFNSSEFLTELQEKIRKVSLTRQLNPEPTANKLEAFFLGRRVYTMAVNMPNISSLQGSWIVKFSEMSGSDPEGQLLPPSPWTKVDPAYSRTAMEEGIEGEVVLSGVIRSDGKVTHVKLIKSLDERLDQAARVAFSKWRFHPALKNGVPVDIEVMVRVPFSVTPLSTPVKPWY